MPKRNEILKERFEQIKKDLKQATLVAVSKFKPIDDLVAAYECGQRDFGENRIQELKEKADYFEKIGIKDIRWHFIGHLQTNKINTLFKIPNLFYIHSVDSLKLLKELYKKKGLLEGRVIHFLLEIKTSGEEEKEGIESIEELHEVINLVLAEKNSALVFSGFMTMGKIRTDDLLKEAKICFKKLKDQKEKIEIQYHFSNLKLSMGMSHDWKIAIDEGADFVRVGSLIFSDQDI